MPVVSKYFLRVFLLGCNLITYVTIKNSPHSGKCFCQQQHLKLWANQGSIQMKHRVGKSLVVASFFFSFTIRLLRGLYGLFLKSSSERQTQNRH